MHAWAAALMKEAGLDVAVSGSVPTKGRTTLVLLPYQTVLESQATVPSIALVPLSQDGARETVPPAWRAIARGMTDTLLATFPQRQAKGPGIGPIDPCPPLAALPASIAAWYRANAEGWMVDRGTPSGRLPSVAWRLPFAFAVRYAAMVVDPEGSDPDIDLVRLRALAVIGAGVRIDRFVRVRIPAESVPPELEALVRAFGAVDVPEAAPILEALDSALAERELAVGLTPHQELSDADIAHVTLALGQPMQATLVFSMRLALGAGPELGPGGLPHLGSVTGERP
jgi:hypothetical protein